MGETEVRDDLARMRTLLAAERTFSAWIRTGLAGVGGGLFIVKLVPFRRVGHQIAAHVAGELLVVWGATIFVFAFWDFRRTYRSLNMKDVPRSLPKALVLMSALLFISAVILTWIVFVTMGP